MDIILATKSPRRHELFRMLTDNFTFEPSCVDESGVTAETSEQLCLALACLKSADIASRRPESCVVGCDTVVEVDGEVFGKPKDKDDARRMLVALSGRVHDVYTGVSISGPDINENFTCHTEVEFFPMSDREIEEYISTPEPYDKAGAYGIQGGASKYIKGINGDFFNVMGLPVSLVYKALKRVGADV